MKQRTSGLGWRLPSLAIGCLSVLGTTAFAASLTVTVDNIEENRGRMHVVIYDDANWMAADPAKFAGGKSVDLSERKDDGPLVTEVELEPGEYAAFAYHDLNSNSEFDRNFMRIPEEPFAFSGPFKKLQKPQFKDFMFVVGQDGAAISLVLLK